MIQSLRIWINQRQSEILPKDSLGARFARGAFWSLVGTVIAQGLSMVASIVTARFLGKVGFGEWGMITSTVGMFGTFAGLGLGLTATKHIAEWRTKDPARAGRLLGLTTQVAVISSGLISIILFVLAPWLAANTLNAPHLVNELRLSCLLLFFNALNGLQVGALSGFEAFKTITRVSFWRGLLSFPVMIAGVWFFELMGVVAAAAIVSMVGWWLNQKALRQECARAGIAVAYRGGRSELPVLWNFSLPAFLGGVVVGPFLWLANALLANQAGGYGELGLVNAANQWRNVLMLLPGIFASVSLPMLSARQDDKATFERTLEISQSVAIIAVVPAGSVIILLGNWIMNLYGPEFAAGAPIFAVLLTGVAIAATGNAVGSAIQATGRMWLGAFMNLTWGGVYILFTALLVRRWGGMALALGFALAYQVLVVWGYAYLYSARLISRGMMVRMFSAGGFVIAVACASGLLPENIRLYLAAPVLLISLWLSLRIWTARFVHQRILESCSVLLREKYVSETPVVTEQSEH